METGQRQSWTIRRGPAAGLAALLVLLTGPGCWRGEPLPPEGPGRLTIELRSPAFNPDGMIPKSITCDGEDRSPALEWSGVPESARSLALLCDDPDAPMGTWSHWVVFNLSPRARGLKPAVPAEADLTATATESAEPTDGNAAMGQQGRNDFGKTGYGGPCPPSGSHHYIFRIFALDTWLDLGPSAKRADVLKAIRSHVLAEGRLVGVYERER